jgi:hypothetical protein
MSVFLSGSLAVGSGASPASFTELSGSGYARAAVTLTQVAPGQIVILPGETFGPATAAWATATQYAIIDGTGNIIFIWMLRSPFTLAAGNTHSPNNVQFSVYDLSATAGASNTAFAWTSGAAIGVMSNGTKVFAASNLQVANGAVTVVSSMSGLLIGTTSGTARDAALAIAAENAAASAASAAQTTANAALPNTIAALTALLNLLPTTIPGSPGVYWLNNGVLCKS